MSEFLTASVGNFSSRVNTLLDTSTITNQVPSSNSGVRRKNEPAISSSQAAQWQAVLWDRMEKLFDFIHDEAARITVLDKVLSKQYKEEVIARWWTLLSAEFERQIRLLTRSSAFLAGTFQSEYPRILRFIKSLSERIEMPEWYLGLPHYLPQACTNPSATLK